MPSSKRTAQLLEVLYYVALVAISYAATRAERDDPPLSVVFYYRLSRTCQAIARTFGRVGLASEHAYYRALERVKL